MSYTATVVLNVLIVMVAVISMYILMGLTGIFSMGQASFMCIGAYTVGILATKFGFRIIKQINAAGTTILLIEQNARQALGISDYTYVLENGHITLEGSSAQLLADPAVQKAYLGD